MAKKSRSKLPPSNLPRVAVARATEDGPNRKVRKEEARRQRELLMRRAARRRFYRWGAAGAIVVAALVVGALLVLNKGSSLPNPKPTPGVLQGMQTGPAPWTQGLPGLKQRLEAIGLPALPKEQLAYHIHMHLEVFVDGNPVTVPADVGINTVSDTSQQFITVLHTHDASGIIHVESPVQKGYTLGQFFDVWGVRFSSTCVGGYCASGNKQIRVYLAGKPYTGDPRGLVLKQHEEIVVTYGTKAQLPKPIPSDYSSTLSPSCAGPPASC